MRVEAMVRELVGQCSSVVHAVRLATVVSWSRESFRAEAESSDHRAKPSRLGAAEARDQACRPLAGQSEDDRRSVVPLPRDRAPPASRR